MSKNFIPSRRDLLKSGGALVVSFSFFGRPAETLAQAAAAAKPVALTAVDTFLAIDAAGMVTVYSGKVDLGTGVRTALAQIVADELDVPFNRVEIVQGDTALTPDQGPTFGSLSIQVGGVQIRNAAAMARSALLDLAATQLGVKPEELTVSAGTISGGGKTVSYGDLIGGKAFSLAVDHTKPPKTKDAKDFKIVGTSVPRVDIPDKVTGKFTYMHDFRVPGMLHGRVIRPPAIGATLQSVDESSISGIAGVVKLVREGNFLGVVAENEWAAIKAAQQLKATWSSWEGLPEQDKLMEHVRATKVAKDDVTGNVGNAKEAMSKDGVKKITATYDFAIHTHGSIGPSCAIAEFKDGKLTSWSASQATHNLRKQLAKMLASAAGERALHLRRGLRLLRPQRPRGCGRRRGSAGEGGRPAGPRAMVARRRTRLGSERAADADRPARRARRSGTVTAWDSEFFMPQQTPKMFMVPLVAATLSGLPADETVAPGNVHQNSNIPYKFANINIVCHRLETTPFRPSWIRTPGRMQNTYANECFIDELAAAAGADPIDFRLKYLDPNDKRGIEVLNRVAALAKWDKRPSPKKRPKRRRGDRPWRVLLQVRAGPHLYRRRRRGRGQALDRRHPRHPLLRRSRLRPDHQSRRDQEPDRRQRDPDREPHAQGGAEIQPLDGDEPRLGELSDSDLPGSAGDRHGSDRSAGGKALGRRRAVGGRGAVGDLERGVRCDRRAAALGAVHARQGQKGAARRRLSSARWSAAAAAACSRGRDCASLRRREAFIRGTEIPLQATADNGSIRFAYGRPRNVDRACER